VPKGGKSKKPSTTPAAATTPGSTSTCPNSCGTPTPSGNGGSTTVQVDRANKKVTIKTKMEYSGPDADQKYADYAKKEIEDTWKGKTTIDGQEYDVVTEIETKVRPAADPPTAGYDQITVDGSTTRMSQSLWGKGKGSQTPAAMQPDRRRIAHEYGHTLGLPDEYHDDPKTGAYTKNDPSKKNNIMSATWKEDGKFPGPYPEHFQQVLKSHGCTK
jgi:M6 family metalloprotease-like protein